MKKLIQNKGFLLVGLLFIFADFGVAIRAVAADDDLSFVADDLGTDMSAPAVDDLDQDVPVHVPATPVPSSSESDSDTSTSASDVTKGVVSQDSQTSSKSSKKHKKNKRKRKNKSGKRKVKSAKHREKKQLRAQKLAEKNAKLRAKLAQLKAEKRARGMEVHGDEYRPMRPQGSRGGVSEGFESGSEQGHGGVRRKIDWRRPVPSMRKSWDSDSQLRHQERFHGHVRDTEDEENEDEVAFHQHGDRDVRHDKHKHVGHDDEDSKHHERGPRHENSHREGRVRWHERDHDKYKHVGRGHDRDMRDSRAKDKINQESKSQENKSEHDRK
ncbi:hypothetical protein IPF37_01215 [bacterium]|nr:MAG: hypothetical protein IPF37_01215 [bacterium]